MAIHGPDGTERVVPLRAGPLSVLLLLIARRDVVGDGVAEDVLRCLRGRNVLARPADDDGQLAFEVHRIGVVRAVGSAVFGPTMAVLGFMKMIGVTELAAAHLRDVGGVVLADAHHLAGQDRGEQPDIGERPLPASESRVAERMLGDLTDDRRLVIG